MALPESPYSYAFNQPRPSLGFNPIDSFVDLLHGATKPFRRANEYGQTMQRLQSAGISGHRADNPGTWWGSDADRLAQLTVNKPYSTDSRVQAQYLALLKQLGYLPHQAF